MFPGGIVRVDEAHVWRSLSAWIAAAPGRETRQWRSERIDSFSCQLLDSHGGLVAHGMSKLGILDAIAQALQIAEGRAA